MKCPNCGVENSIERSLCVKCRKDLLSFEGLTFTKYKTSTGRIDRTPKRDAQKSGSVHPEVVAKKLKFEYAFGKKETNYKIQESLQRLLLLIYSPNLKLSNLLNSVARIIHETFEIGQVTIGTKSQSDGLYRYNAYYGITKSAESAFKKIQYTYDEFMDTSKYPGTAISDYSKLFLAEMNPYAEGEEMTYNRPVMLQSTRKDENDSIEGDYIDIYIFDAKKDLIGWIEISGTKTGKLPTAETIRWLEILANIVGLAMSNLKSERPVRYSEKKRNI